jgi:hypothetical protein
MDPATKCHDRKSSKRRSSIDSFKIGMANTDSRAHIVPFDEKVPQR